jgi:uncharacterized membrane protein
MGNSYLWLKSLHLLGVMAFLGNIIVTGWWKFTADRTRNPQVIAFAQRQVTLTDYAFTAGGATLLLAAGWADAALRGMSVFHTLWLSWGLSLFTASGIIWVAILVPIQHRQAHLACEFSVTGHIPPDYWRLCRRWLIWGTIATIFPLMNLYWMVLKPVKYFG